MTQVLGSVSAGGLGFLCPRSAGPWGAAFSAARPPAAAWPWLLAAHAWAWLVEAAERACLWGRWPVWCPPTCCLQLCQSWGLPQCGQQAPRRLWPTGLGCGPDLCPVHLQVLQLFPGQKEGLGWWLGPGQHGIRAAVVRKGFLPGSRPEPRDREPSSDLLIGTHLRGVHPWGVQQTDPNSPRSFSRQCWGLVNTGGK